MEEMMKTIDEEERKNAMYLRLLSCLLRKTGSIDTPPASRTIRSPAATSHACIPNSKEASTPPRATMHIFRAAAPNDRIL
ncbi:hypothetical protein ALC60_07029 [Trachymyrmex zeteki]|uniref:Uncharacterized protein n=1 Tax=Mycetomoellerius zeteki TaxID=64791 RepID=A0A151X112_9HYME|nr:hypothetical protein ALC60_07029 [Trachymyrmex zeteki]